MTTFDISRNDMAMVYMSPDPYFESFEQQIDLHQFDLTKHSTAGLSLVEHDGRLNLTTMIPGTPAAKIKDWRSHVKGAWLIKIGTTLVTSVETAHDTLAATINANKPIVTLLFAHPEVRPNLSHDGIPIVSSAPFTQAHHDQLNNRWEFSTVAEHLRTYRSDYSPVNSGGIFNLVTKVMKLTCGKLLKGPNWTDWQNSEYFQLNQYHAQGLFVDPTLVAADAAVFHTVWTYNIKALDLRKKARCVCDGSPRAGDAIILDETYTNCVDQTSSRLFYGISAAENLLIYGADVSNAFGKAPPPKQGFYIYPDRAFHEWWVLHLKRPPLQPGQVIPVLSAMQGHPESP
jgi:hypothetical protein